MPAYAHDVLSALHRCSLLRRANNYSASSFGRMCSAAYLSIWSLKRRLTPARDASFASTTGAHRQPVLSSRSHALPTRSFRRYVCFRNSELLSGRLGKVTLGSGNKAGLFYVLSSDYSPDVAANAMNRLAKLSARWLGTRGFSIGIADVTPDSRLISEKERQVGNVTSGLVRAWLADPGSQVHEGYAECERLIALYKEGALQLLPGCTAEQTLESSILGVLSRVREVAGNVCLEQLPRHNSPLIMALCGSKGSTINICQMIACVGQQAVSGSRIQDGAS